MNVNEDLTKSEVRSMIDSYIEDYVKELKFKKMIKDIAAECLENFIDEMYRKRSFFKGALRR